MKFLSLEGFKYAMDEIVTKIKALINLKADKSHTHNASDIATSSENQFINADEKNKISKITINGNGQEFLSSDGTYKHVEGGGSKISIDDENIASQTTYSSNKIEGRLNSKADIIQLHTHNNKNILDGLSVETYAK